MKTRLLIYISTIISNEVNTEVPPWNERLPLCLLVTSAVNCFLTNSLDPDQARQNVGPDQDPNCLTLMVFLKEFWIDWKSEIDIQSNLIKL